MIIPQQLVTELMDNINSKIKQYIDNNQERAKLNLKNIISEAFDTYWSEDGYKEVINKNMRELRKNRKKKKTNWYMIVERDVKQDRENPANPVFSTWIAYKNLPTTERIKLGWDVSFDEIVKNKLAEMKEWAENTETYFIECPFLEYFSDDKIYVNIRSDVFVDIYDYMKANYDLNLANYQKIYTETIIKNPLFGEKKIPLENIKDEGTEYIDRLNLDGVVEFSTIIKKQMGLNKELMKSLGPLDNEIIQGIFKRIDNDFYHTREVTAKLRYFADIICSDKTRWNATHLNKVAMMLTSYQYLSWQNNDLTKNVAIDSFDFFDRIKIVNPADFEPTPEYPFSPNADVVIHFGDRLYMEIVEQNVIKITEKDYKTIDTPLAHLLNPSLQLQRLLLTRKIPAETLERYQKHCDVLSYKEQNVIDTYMTNDYPYTFFSLSVRTLAKRNRNNIEAIKNVLNMYVEQNLYVKHYEYKNYRFIITFYPLSEDELKDTSFIQQTEEFKQISLYDILSN